MSQTSRRSSWRESTPGRCRAKDTVVLICELGRKWFRLLKLLKLKDVEFIAYLGAALRRTVLCWLGAVRRKPV